MKHQRSAASNSGTEGVNAQQNDQVSIVTFAPCCQIFPLMKGEEFEALVLDIKTNGLCEPITMLNGAILDGRNRFRACRKAGVEPRFRQWDGKGSAVAFVISQNLARRHLTPSQCACLAVELLPLHEAEAAARQQMTHVRGGVKGRRGGKPVPVKLPAPDRGEARDRVGKLVKVSPAYVSRAKKLKAERPKLFEQVKTGAKTLQEAARAVKEEKREATREENRKLVESIPLPMAAHGVKYQTIVIDPPWDWGDEGDQDQMGRARPTYATVPFKDLLKLNVKDLAAENAHLYLWITNRSLPKGFELLNAWGFRYVTCIIWVKPTFGLGNYFRGSTELILFGIRGSLALLRNDVGTHFAADRGEQHSEKPSAFFELVESCSPGPWIEMFARKQRPGWAAWGAEVPPK